MTTILDRSTPDARNGPEPMLAGEKTPTQMVLVKVFAIVPLLALAAAVPVAWGWGLGWVDIGLVVFFYTLTCLGVTIGFHRHFTHGAFKARRGLRIALAVVGSMAVQGPVINWVADHRRITPTPTRKATPTHRGCSAPQPPLWPRASGTPTWDGCSSGSAPTPTGSPQICWPTTTSNASTDCSRC